MFVLNGKIEGGLFTSETRFLQGRNYLFCQSIRTTPKKSPPQKRWPKENFALFPFSSPLRRWQITHGISFRIVIHPRKTKPEKLQKLCSITLNIGDLRQVLRGRFWPKRRNLRLNLGTHLPIINSNPPTFIHHQSTRTRQTLCKKPVDLLHTSFV